MLRLAATYTATGSTAAAGYLGWRSTPEAGTIAALVALAVLAVAGRAYLAGWRPPVPRPARHQLVSLLLVGLVVSGGVVASTGTASAAQGDSTVIEVSQTCGTTEYLFSMATLGLGAVGDCWDIEKASYAQAGDDLEAYSQMSSMSASQERMLNVQQNMMQDTRSVAWTKAKIEMAQRLNSGNATTASALAAYGNDTVEQYYSRIQKNIIEDWNARAAQVNYTDSTGFSLSAKSGGNYFGVCGFVKDGNSRPLANGTSIGVNVLKRDCGTGPYDVRPNSDGTADPIVMDDPSTPDTTERQMVLNTTRYHVLMGSTFTQMQQVKSNIYSYAQGLASKYQTGDFNISNWAERNPTAIAAEAATQYNSTGYQAFAAAQLAAMGASGNISTSHTIEYSSTGGVESGTLYYSGDDLAYLNTSETYDPANYNGTFWLASSDGIKEVDSGFKILEQVNTQTGETVNQTRMETKVYRTHNASNLEAELARLADLIQEVESQSAGAGGSGSGIGQNGLIAIAAVAGALVLLGSRKNGGNGGGRRGRY